jgi:hypothetical protein
MRQRASLGIIRLDDRGATAAQQSLSHRDNPVIVDNAWCA